MNYLQRILCDFSDDLSRIDVHVEGFKAAEGEQNIIGASFSCGVDSLSTIYDRYIKEDDPDYKINGLFFFNVGWHGDFYDAETEKLFFARYTLNKPAADELGLPVYLANTNFHAFMYGVYGNNYPGGHMGYFANYSCVFALGKSIKKYYAPSGRSYEGTKNFSRIEQHDSDLCGFADPYAIPLISTEQLEFIIDGCQYDRPQKVENIADWNIAQKYLNVCVVKADLIDNAHNCSKCDKCLRTLTEIDIAGKLDNFARVFNLNIYKKLSFANKCYHVINSSQKYHSHDICEFAKKYGVKFPSPLTAKIYFLAQKVNRLSKHALQKLTGERFYNAIKRILKR